MERDSFGTVKLVLILKNRQTRENGKSFKFVWLFSSFLQRFVSKALVASLLVNATVSTILPQQTSASACQTSNTWSNWERVMLLSIKTICSCHNRRSVLVPLCNGKGPIWPYSFALWLSLLIISAYEYELPYSYPVLVFVCCLIFYYSFVFNQLSYCCRFCSAQARRRAC